VTGAGLGRKHRGVG